MSISLHCKRCGAIHQPGHPQWTCCPVHVTSPGEWVCDACAVKLHPEKAAIVTHKMYGDDFTLPCCGVLYWEAPPTDRVAIKLDDIVTCTGAKRYREKGDQRGAPNRAARRAAQRTHRHLS